jgi:hypothetical protein
MSSPNPHICGGNGRKIFPPRPTGHRDRRKVFPPSHFLLAS